MGLEIINLNTERQRIRWNKIVKSFKKSNIYYNFHYLLACKLHGDGEPLLFYYKKDEKEICIAVLKNKISEFKKFKNITFKKELYDISTPYGYGGFLFNDEEKISDDFVEKFFNEFKKYCLENNIVSLFIRFNPVEKNHILVENFCNIVNLKKTVYICTTSKEEILKNMSIRCRRNVKKANKLNTTIKIDKGENLKDFLRLYYSTMKKNNAENYYYFNESYFEYFIKNMKDKFLFFSAINENKIIASIMLIYDKYIAYYHLGGTNQQYRHFSPMSLVLYEAAIWVCKSKIEKFYLGGGVNFQDSLFEFKKNFNKNESLDFYIGRIIFSKKEFNYLLDLRKKNDNNFNICNDYLISYRA
ncbi:MAG: GNAT family N-acetyltransferase [Oscillospiraceae bacterium]|nr:GNAT family N-acetyltransferase [Oscillospiraceae bacterium]